MPAQHSRNAAHDMCTCKRRRDFDALTCARARCAPPSQVDIKDKMMEIHDIRVKGKFTVDPGRSWILQGPNTTEFAQKKTDPTEFGFIVSLWVAPPLKNLGHFTNSLATCASRRQGSATSVVHQRPRSYNRPAARVFSQVPAHRPRRTNQTKNRDARAQKSARNQRSRRSR